jgi:hypothetical protein
MPRRDPANAKLAKCVVSSNSFMSTLLTDLSNQVIRLRSAGRCAIALRGKTQEFQSLVKSEILPVYKKAKANLAVLQRGPGANPADVVLATGYAKYADMNGGPFLVQQLGQAGADKVNAKFAGIRTTVEVVVRRRVPDLSF